MEVVLTGGLTCSQFAKPVSICFSENDTACPPWIEVECETVLENLQSQAILQDELENCTQSEQTVPIKPRPATLKALKKQLKKVFSMKRFKAKSPALQSQSLKGQAGDELSVATTSVSSASSWLGSSEGTLVPFVASERYQMETLSLHSTCSNKTVHVTQPTGPTMDASSVANIEVAILNPQPMTESDILLDDNTVSSEATVASSVSWESTDKETFELRPLMEQRLLDTGKVTLDAFSFVTDHVSKEVLQLRANVRAVNQMDTDTNVSHVKTGIWQVTCFEDDGEPMEPQYIVTGVAMDDRVDTKKLRKVVFSGQNYVRRPKLILARTEIAEKLAGYKSGTMAPICHSQNMKLYLEETLVSGVDPKSHRFNVGSGIFGKCLSISLKDFLEVAGTNPKGYEIRSIIQNRKER